MIMNIEKFNAETIEQLCNSWCEASILPDGGMAMGEQTEKYRLLRNGAKFHEFDFDCLCASLIGLSTVLLRPGLNTFIDHDHYALWSWCGELLSNSRQQLFPEQQYEIWNLYKTSIHASLANCRKPPCTQEEWQQQNRISDAQPHHAKLLLHESHLILAYLGFPLLEAVLKQTCSAYVDINGKVISTFTVPTRTVSKEREYSPQGRSQQCSSLRDLLFLTYNSVAEPDLQALIEKFRSHISFLDNTQDPFDLIYSWRNQSLHGSTNFMTIGGTLLNLSLLISLHKIKSQYEDMRYQTLQHCIRNDQIGYKSHDSFYPPY